MIEVRLVESKEKNRDKTPAKTVLVTGLSRRQATMIANAKYEVSGNIRSRRGNEIFFQPKCDSHFSANTDDGMYSVYFDAYMYWGTSTGRESKRTMQT